MKTMNCDWTEKISLLIDGELDATEARAVESHLADCHACQHAREDFLLMRQQIVSYSVEPDVIAQRNALNNILGVDARRASSPSASSRGWRERIGGVFTLPRLSHALAAAFALLLVGIVIGVVLMRRPERVEVAVNPNHNAGANTNEKLIAMPAPITSSNESTSSTPQPRATFEKNVEGIARIENASGVKPRRASSVNAMKLRVDEARQPKIINRLKLPLAPKLAVDPAELVETEIATLRSKVEPSDLGTSQHVEQAQRLLRSFRNARTEGQPSVSDIAYEKRRSRELLYRNIVLRREAVAKGNDSVASVLDSLEPILIDIANLPDNPARADVHAITERMRKKNIVAMLQVANGSRMY
ncbi:MAG: hypothetical protein QOE33_3568 [Acidobacteriota bacterium]|nr:hypothetical protein [Acidobacteriota bacterium]